MTTVVGTFQDGGGTPNTGRVIFQLATAAADDTPIVFTQSPVSVLLDVTGSISVDLQPTDDLNVEGDVYQVTESLTGQPVKNYYVQVAATPDPVNIADLIPFAHPPRVVFIPGNSGGGGGGVTDHGALTGLTDDDHGQYLLQSQVLAGTNVTVTPSGGVTGPVTIAATGGGVTDHGALTGLADDDHPQYETAAEVAAQITTHAAAPDPHPVYETAAEVSAKVTTHEAAADPHPTYLRQAEVTGTAPIVVTPGAANAGVVVSSLSPRVFVAVVGSPPTATAVDQLWVVKP